MAITAAWGFVFVINALVAALLAFSPGWPLGHLRIGLGAVSYLATLSGVVFTNRFPQWASTQWASKELV